MKSVMTTSDDGGLASPPDPGSSAAGEEKTVSSTTAVGSAGGVGFSTAVGSSGEAARVGIDGSDETRISDNVSEPRVLKLENEENRFGDARGGENQPSSSVSKTHGTSKKTGSRSGKLEHKKNRSVVEDYDSILSAFDEFAAREKDEAVGYGYKVGDMVWGKVKSHPWWPGHIYNEAFASQLVRRGKHEGHVLVAFFGDSSYGWFDPAELIPFEENFAEKSRQTMSRSFLRAVEEAVDELSRRSSLGLSCRCRNEFNFWPSNVEGHLVVDVGDHEPGVYGLSQICKARESFQPWKMLSFIEQMALEPMNDQYWTIDYIKNKAIVLAYRKASFEEFDETYAQAFGTLPVRPPRPTAPVALDPAKAPLSGRLVIAETLGKGKISAKTTKTKDQVEKDKYLFKRRDESIQMKSKKASSSQAGHSPHLLSIDGQYSGIRDHMPQASDTAIPDGQHLPSSHQASFSIDVKLSEGSRKLVEGGTKKVKVPKRPAGEFTTENATSVKKKKKKKGISTETDVKPRDIPAAFSNSTVAAENASGTLPHVQLIDNNGLGDQKKDTPVSSSSSQSQEAVDFGKFELQMLVTDLCALALNPFHGEQRSCPAVIRQVFLKFRSLVYQKSLVLAPPAESDASESNSSRLPAPTPLVSPIEKPNEKTVKPSVRLDDPTKGGKKRGPSDRLEDVKKKKLDVLEGVKKKKVDDSWDSKKKKIDNSKLLTVEKRILQRSTESQRGDVKDISAKVVPPRLPKAVKLESSKRMEHAARVASPTMLVMKFPAGAALPSGAELRAKFARFGPLDHSATRIFWKSYTCRLVYLHKIDAEAALKSAVGSSNLFGNANVKCYLRELEVEAAESEPVKLQKENALVGATESRDTATEQRMAPKIASQPLQHPQSSVQLKSCLKKPSGDEGANGGGRGARVKFVLGGEERSKGELQLNENKKNNFASFPQGASSIHSMDLSSKILPKFNPQTSNTVAPSTSPFQKFPVSMPPSEQGPRQFNAPQTPQMSGAPPSNDISQQMLSLLTRCNDVVNNLAAALGYMPYHPL